MNQGRQVLGMRPWNTTLPKLYHLPLRRDSGWWAVWLGRHPPEKVSGGP